jgi:membrane protein implicated in regulation of membrane protease activity
VLVLVGLVWIGQGAGFIGGSVVTGDPLWAIVGVVLVGLALAIAVREWRRTTRG